jgi:hypothetical protein
MVIFRYSNHTGKQRQKLRQLSGVCGLWVINMFRRGSGVRSRFQRVSVLTLANSDNRLSDISPATTTFDVFTVGPSYIIVISYETLKNPSLIRLKTIFLVPKR